MIMYFKTSVSAAGWHDLYIIAEWGLIEQEACSESDPTGTNCSPNVSRHSPSRHIPLLLYLTLGFDRNYDVDEIFTKNTFLHCLLVSTAKDSFIRACIFHFCPHYTVWGPVGEGSSSQLRGRSAWSCPERSSSTELNLWSGCVCSPPLERWKGKERYTIFVSYTFVRQKHGDRDYHWYIFTNIIGSFSW